MWIASIYCPGLGWPNQDGWNHMASVIQAGIEPAFYFNHVSHGWQFLAEFAEFYS